MSTKTGFAPSERDHFGRREERERHGDDFVARTDVERHQRHQQRVGAAGHTDAVFGPDVGCQLLLQFEYLGPENVLAVLEYLRDSCVNRRLEPSVLGLEVDEIHGVPTESAALS